MADNSFLLFNNAGGAIWSRDASEDFVTQWQSSPGLTLAGEGGRTFAAYPISETESYIFAPNATAAPYVVAALRTVQAGFDAPITFPAQPTGRYAIAISPDKTCIVTAGEASGNVLDIFRAYSLSETAGVVSVGAALNVPVIGDFPTSDYYRCVDIKFSPDGTVLFAALVSFFTERPVIFAWRFDGSGFGLPYTPVAGVALISECNKIAVHPDGNEIAVALDSDAVNGKGGVAVYAWDNTTGFGAVTNKPASLSSSVTGACVAYSPDGNYILLGIAAAGTTLYCYPWDGVTFGTAVFPIDAPASTPCRFISFNDAADLVAVGFDGNDRIYAWDWAPPYSGTKKTFAGPSPGGTVTSGGGVLPAFVVPPPTPTGNVNASSRKIVKIRNYTWPRGQLIDPRINYPGTRK